MFIPLMSTIYSLIRDDVNGRNERKNRKAVAEVTAEMNEEVTGEATVEVTEVQGSGNGLL